MVSLTKIIPSRLISWSILGAGKTPDSKALIAVTSRSNCQINNEASGRFNQHK